jgi:hypothetical protein
MLGFKDMRERYFNWFSKNNIDPNTTISMHFRLGDYKKLKIVLSLDYYSKSLLFILDKYQISNPTILYFCERENITEVSQNINTLQTTYPQCTFRYCNIASQLNTCVTSINQQINGILGIPEDEMIIMSNCKYNIIANSTFSWWAAYIGDREDENTHGICYPDIINPDLYPEHWKRIV